MQIREITYSHKFGRPNYSSEEFALTATLAEDEDAIEASLVLKSHVLYLGGDDLGSQRALDDAHRRYLEREGRAG